MIHYSMVHEPVGIVDSLGAVLMSWELPCQFYMIQHTTVGSWISVFLEDAVSINFNDNDEGINPQLNRNAKITIQYK